MILILGDIHGILSPIVNTLTNIDIDEKIHIIQVGDFGIDMIDNQEQKLESLNKKLIEKNATLYIVRGNHDNPFYFKRETNENNSILHLSNIQFLEDNTILEIEHKRILCVGGAISIDRKERVLGFDYWLEEKFIKPNVEEHYCITDVITHSAPDIFFPYKPLTMGSFDYLNESIIYDVYIERKELTEMFYELKKNNHIQNWIYGHFHISNVDYIEGTKTICLGINEFKELR